MTEPVSADATGRVPFPYGHLEELEALLHDLAHDLGRAQRMVTTILTTYAYDRLEEA